MSKGQMLRVLVKQRLTAAAEEIFGLFERTIAEYEEELCRSREENERQRELLDAVFKPQLRLHRADVQQLSLRIEEVPSEKREWSRCLDQKDAPKPPHIKEEQEEEKLWTSVEGEKLLEETLTPIPVKKEDDVEKPQTSQLHQTEQMKTEPNGEDCGGPALDKLPDNDEDSPESETEDNDDDWEATREPESGSNFLNNNEVSVSDVGLKTGMKKTFICSECGKRFNRPSKLMAHKGTHTEGRPFSCSVCSKTFGCKTSLQDHVKGHKRERNFCCSLCGKCFLWNSDFELHMRTHTGEKPFSCTFCNKTFTQKGGLQCHLASHTGEKPFSCSICSKTFGRKGTLWKHMIRHSGEKRFSCPLCKKCFYWKSGLHLHMRTHTGEKPFSCPICGKTLGSKVTLQNHVRAHTGEKPFSCSLCGKMFGNKRTLQNHVRTHTGEKPYSCRVCDRRFVWHWQLRKHKCSGESSDQGPP